MRATGNSLKAIAALSLMLGLGVLLPRPSGGQSPEPVVHAVLFYSPTCPHCHDLINNHLIPLQDQYGSRFVILAFDVTQSWAGAIYRATLEHYEVPRADWVVPIVVIKDEILIGGDVIPPRLTQILQEGLAGDGVDLPDLPPVLTFLEEQGMLDTRYPGRRIVLQSPPQDQAAAEEGARPGEPPAGDSAGTPDSIPTSPDTQAVAPGAPAAAPGARADSVAGEARDTAGAGEGTPSDRPAAPMPDRPAPGGEPVEGGREAGAETSPDTASPGVDSARLPVAEGAAASPGEAPGPRPTDLARAVEEMGSRTMVDRFNQDRKGNSLSVLVLLGMLASLILRGYPPGVGKRGGPVWVVPLLVLVGMGVATYLSFIEITHSEAVCGPVGDCNTVNQSEYATLFGFLPVGVMGLLGYLSILAFWILGRFGPEGWRARGDLALWAAALLGTLFSAYLTFLEPFVIGATCAWCLSSAVIMTLLLWATSPLAAAAWQGGREGDA